MEAFNFENGDIVIVKKEVRLHSAKNCPFGIIVEQVGATRPDGSKIVSLHLFDKEGKLYEVTEGPNYIPTYVDYNTKELIPYKQAKEPGYKELYKGPELTEE